MTQAIVDPGELRRFAQMLRRFNEEINEKTAAVAGLRLALVSRHAGAGHWSRPGRRAVHG